MALERETLVIVSKEGAKHTATDAAVVRRPWTAFKVTTASDTAPKDSFRAADATDFWKDTYLIGVECTAAANEGAARLVTSFSTADGTATLASAMPGTVASNDIFVFGNLVKPNEGGVSYSPEINEIVRNVLGGTLDPEAPVSILTGATAQITAHVVGVKSYPAADAQIGKPPMADLFVAAMGSVTRDSPSVVAAGGIPTNKQQQFSIGNAVAIEDANSTGLVKDEITWISGKTDNGAGEDNLSFKPATTASTVGKRVYASATFGLLDSLHPRVTVEIYQPDTATDGQEVILHNCLSTFEMGGDVSNLLEATFDLVASDIKVGAMAANHHARTLDTSGLNEEPSFGPIQTINGLFSFRTAPNDSTQGAAYLGDVRDITNYKFSLGATIAKKGSMSTATGVKSTLVSGRNPTLTISGFLEGSFPDFSDLTGSIIKDVQLQLGGDKEVASVDTATLFALRVPSAKITGYSQGASDGLITLELTLQASRNTNQSFEDPDDGDTGLHNSPNIQDSFRFALI